MKSTTPATGDDQVEVVKWYTHVRRFPQLIGKTHNGTSLWGGPYTLTQILIGAGVLIIGGKTHSWWGRSGLVVDALLLIGIAYGAVVLAGRIPIGARNPLSVVTGLVTAFSRPRFGTVAGSPIRLRPPHLVAGRTDFAAGYRADPIPAKSETPISASTSPAPTTFPTPAVAARPRPALSGVQRLLASAGTHPQE